MKCEVYFNKMYWHVQSALIYFCVFYILLILLTKLFYCIFNHLTPTVKKNLYKKNNFLDKLK